MQSFVREKKLSAEKVLGAQNPADIGTRALTSFVLNYLMSKCGTVSGSAESHAIVGVTSRRTCERCCALEKALLCLSNIVAAK